MPYDHALGRVPFLDRSCPRSIEGHLHLFLSAAQQPVPLSCTAACSSQLHSSLFLSAAQQPVPLSCTAACSSQLHSSLFLSAAHQPVPLSCTAACSSQLHSSLFLSAAQQPVPPSLISTASITSILSPRPTPSPPFPPSRRDYAFLACGFHRRERNAAVPSSPPAATPCRRLPFSPPRLIRRRLRILPPRRLVAACPSLRRDVTSPPPLPAAAPASAPSARPAAATARRPLPIQPQLHPPFFLSLLLSPPLPLPLRPSLPRPACRRRPSFRRRSHFPAAFTFPPPQPACSRRPQNRRSQNRRRGPSAVACALRRCALLAAAAPDFATASPSRRRTFAQPPAPLSPSLPAP
ncbi:unnamed protein product [Closterium sp. NIES-64]|nr:unnamed protein product [Closterium sp. NIES-64]